MNIFESKQINRIKQLINVKHGIIKPIVSEQIPYADDLPFPPTDIDDPLAGYGYDIKTDNIDTTKYIVFVAGTNTTGIAHKTQYDKFKSALGDVNQKIKYFNYDDHNNSGSILFKWLEENKSNVDYLILFSAACYLANRLSPTYVPTSKTFCIEPWASEKSKPSWTNISADNFYVNANDWRRGANAKENIPEENKNKLTNHVSALVDAIGKIF